MTTTVASLKLTRMSVEPNWVRQGRGGRGMAQIKAEKRLLVA
jgi:hypothetical protein